MIVCSRSFLEKVAIASRAMAPAHASGNAMSRAMGASEENWTKSTALGTGTAVVTISLRRVVESHHVAQACREVMDQHALLRAQAVENAKGKLAFLVKSDCTAPKVEICPWPQTSASWQAGDIAIAGADDGLAIAVNQVIRDEINTPFVNSEKNPSPPLDLFQVLRIVLYIRRLFCGCYLSSVL